jgi:predicted RNase H-like nuclease (RuvC/YqgF family)
MVGFPAFPKEQAMPSRYNQALANTVLLPKGEAVTRIAKHITMLNSQLDEMKTRMKTAVKPGRYALNFQINALKKEIHHWKLQASRISRESRTEVPVPDPLN